MTRYQLKRNPFTRKRNGEKRNQPIFLFSSTFRMRICVRRMLQINRSFVCWFALFSLANRNGIVFLFFVNELVEKRFFRYGTTVCLLDLDTVRIRFADFINCYAQTCNKSYCCCFILIAESIPAKNYVNA